jgi:hypothetical protein
MARKKKSEQKHRGVYEWPKGSGIFRIRYTDTNGKRTKAKIGTSFAAAVDALETKKSEVRLKHLLPAPPVKRGDQVLRAGR